MWVLILFCFNFVVFLFNLMCFEFFNLGSYLVMLMYSFVVWLFGGVFFVGVSVICVGFSFSWFFLGEEVLVWWSVGSKVLMGLFFKILFLVFLSGVVVGILKLFLCLVKFLYFSCFYLVWWVVFVEFWVVVW